MIYFIPTTPVLATANDILFIYKACDPLIQAICILLLLISLAVWGILFDKVCILTKVDENNRRFQRLFFDKDMDSGKLKEAAISSESLMATVYMAAREYLDSHCPEGLGTGYRVWKNTKAKVRAAMSDAIKRQCAFLQKRIPFLKTAVNGSLFLGTAGMLWGIMFAFAKYAQTDCSDIRLLVAGVPAALLPLSIALLAAFPSFLGTRMIKSRLKTISAQLELFADGLCTEMQTGPYGIPEEGFIVQSPGEEKAGFVRECCHAVKKAGKTDADGNCRG